MSKSSATGGRAARPRKKPTANRPEAAIDGALADAATPIEVMLGTMRALWTTSRDAEGRVVDAKTAAAAASLAKDAAPYVHPRLATVDAPVESGLEGLTDAQLDARINDLLPTAAEDPCKTG